MRRILLASVVCLGFLVPIAVASSGCAQNERPMEPKVTEVEKPLTPTEARALLEELRKFNVNMAQSEELKKFNENMREYLARENAKQNALQRKIEEMARRNASSK